MKKIFLGVMFLAGLHALPSEAADDRWGAFVMGSDVAPDETGIGGGAFMESQFVDSIYFTSQVFVTTYDNVDRGQLLIGGEWRDESQRKLTGYVGVQAGGDFVDTDAGSNEDMFARAYYDIGWEYSNGSELRFGLAIDVKSEFTDRDQGVRLGWFQAPGEGMGFFVRGEVYEDETNVFAGGSWGF